MMMNIKRTLSAFLATFVFVSGVAGQGALSDQRLGRAYTHVFIAYAVVWLLLTVWVVTIAKRISRIEAQLKDE